MAIHSAARKVLATAASQIGYNRYADPKRGTKYARETQPVFWPGQTWLLANGIAYCDIFVTWVFWKALGKNFVTDSLPAGASYNTDYRASKGGRVSKSAAQPGDVVVFDWNPATPATNHVGILEKRLASGNLQTIEGNTSIGASGSQSNGGRVARRTRRWSQVKYVIRPQWSEAGAQSFTPAKPATKPAAKPAATKAPAFPLPRKKGAMYFYGRGKEKTAVTGMMRNTAVPGDVIQVGGRWKSKGLALFQARLIARGWSELKKDGADGRFDDTMHKVVGQFQKSMGLPVDHRVGPGTWAAAWTEPVK